MIDGLVLVCGSAFLGGTLALLSRRRPSLLELTRTFAFAAAAAVVVFHLLPEVLPALGPKALLWIGVGFVLPWLLEVGARAVGPGFLERRGLHGMRVAAEVGFVALIFHSVVEGLALLAALQAREDRVDLQIAILAHHAPLTAAVALPFLELLGPRSAAIRVGLVALAGAVGIAMGQLIPGLAQGSDAALIQRATAVTAGALLHVVSDEIRTQCFASRWQRAGDLVASLAGVALAGAGASLDLRNAPTIFSFGRTALSLALATAPAVLLGIACEAAVVRFAHRASFRIREQLEGAFVTVAVLGFPSAIVRVALGLLAVPAARFAGGRRDVVGELRPDLTGRGPWLLALLALAASVDVLAPADWFVDLGMPGLVILAAALAFSARASASGGALLAAALVHRGMPAELAVSFLALSAFAGRRRPIWRWAAAAAGGFGVSLLAAAALGRIGLLRGAAAHATSAFAGSELPAAVQLTRAPFATACLVALGATALWMMWGTGVRGWFAPLRHPELGRRAAAPATADAA